MSEVHQRSYETVRDSLRQRLIDRVFIVMLYGGFGALLLGIYTAYAQRHFLLIGVFISAYASMLVVHFSRKPYYQVKKWLMVSLLYVLGLMNLIFSGWGADGRIFLLAFPVMVTVLISQRVGYYTLGLTILTLLVFAWAILGGYVEGLPIHAVSLRPWLNLLSSITVFSLVDGFLIASVGALFQRLSTQLEDVYRRSVDLQAQQKDLDRRTRALQDLNYAMQRRTEHLEASAEVVRTLSSIFDVDQLLYQAVRLISEKLGFYHTGLFLVAESGDVATLEAASSEGGQQLLAEKHQLRRGEGMVGWVMEHAEPRIALDVEADNAHFENPQLPATRSEAALPLVIADRVIGVLDVQSTEANAFDADDVRSLEYLADQLAVTVENARRFAQDVGVLEATSPFYRMTQRMAAAHQERQVYGVMLEMVQGYSPRGGFVCTLNPERETLTVAAELRDDEILFRDAMDARPTLPALPPLRSLLISLDEALFVEDLHALSEDGVPQAYRGQLRELAQESTARSLAILPIRLGEDITAQLVVVYENMHVFGVSEKQLYIALVDTASVVLENLRLLEAAQRRVAREQAARDVTDRMRRAPDMDSLLAVTAESLLEMLGGGGAYVQLGVPPASEGTDEGDQ